MIAMEDFRMAIVRADLRFIERNARFLGDSPVCLSVAKAITVARLHPDVESRVMCKDLVEADDVIQLLARLADPGDRVSDKECMLEFPNGSAVRVVVEAATGGKRT